MSVEKFPPRILALLHEVADRVGTEFRGPFEDGNGDPLQDDADAALEWIAAAEAGQSDVLAAALQQVDEYARMNEELRALVDAAEAGQEAAAVQAAWMSCASRGLWTRNNLRAIAQKMRDSEKRLRNAYRKSYMGEPCEYIADAYAEAAAVFEARLAALSGSLGDGGGKG